MKTYCKRYRIDVGKVASAYVSWAASVSGSRNSWRVPQEHGSVQALIHEINNEVRNRSLHLSPIRRYVSRESVNRKRRVIGVESVKQQVCDYLAIQAIEPLLSARTGWWQASSQPGKGQLFAAKAVKRWASEGGYWVHLDIKKCYPSISHDVVKRILRKYVKSEDVLYLCETILDSYDNGGLEIGSYFSLRIAQLVLSWGYHHVEGLSKTRRGKRKKLVSHQIWYMDDIWLFGRRKADVRSAARSLQRYLKQELGLTLKSWKICKANSQEPIDVVGYRVRPGSLVVTPVIYLRAMRSFRRFSRSPSIDEARRVMSYWGWLVHADTCGCIERNGLDALQRKARKVISESERKSNARNSLLDPDCAGCCGASTGRRIV